MQPSPLLTAALTIIGGVLVFTIGQFLQRFILEPIQEQRRVIAEIAVALTYYANVSNVGGIGATPEEIQETTKALRNLAAKLRASVEIIPNYSFWARAGVVPVRSKALRHPVI